MNKNKSNRIEKFLFIVLLLLSCFALLTIEVFADGPFANVNAISLCKEELPQKSDPIALEPLQKKVGAL